GGEILLRSNPGEGSIFTLYLPVRKAVETALPAADRQPDGGQPAHALAGRKVLLVDDDPHNLFAVTSLLEHFGVRVLPAHGARECFDLLEKNGDVDLVLMDVMMPEIDG